MDDVGDIRGGTAGREVGGRTQGYNPAGSRHRLRGQFLTRQHHVGLGIEFDTGQHFFVADAAPRIAVDLFDQLRNGRYAIADDLTRRAFGRRDQFAVDHQKTVIIALKEGLDDNRTGMLFGGLESQGDFVIRSKTD